MLRSERYDTRADVFSFGVILWEIHARKIPYSEMNQMQIAVAVATQDHRPPAPRHCPAPFWHLMQHCWQSKPTERPSFPEVLSQLEDMQFVFNLAASAHTGAAHRQAALPQQPQQQHRAELADQQQKLQRMHISAEAHAPAQSPAPLRGASASPNPQASPSPSAASASRRVLRVPEAYDSIKAAMQAAGPDDQISVSAGHYMESLEIREGTLDLVGDGNMQHILLDAPADGSALTQHGGTVRISNMMLRSNAAAPTVQTQNGRLIVQDCNISGGNVGVALASSHADIRRSVLCRCQRQGLLLGAAAVAVLESCSIFENGGHGILATHEGATVQMTRSMVSYNQGAALAVDQGASAKVSPLLSTLCASLQLRACNMHVLPRSSFHRVFCVLILCLCCRWTTTTCATTCRGRALWVSLVSTLLTSPIISPRELHRNGDSSSDRSNFVVVERRCDDEGPACSRTA